MIIDTVNKSTKVGPRDITTHEDITNRSQGLLTAPLNEAHGDHSMPACNSDPRLAARKPSDLEILVASPLRPRTGWCDRQGMRRGMTPYKQSNWWFPLCGNPKAVHSPTPGLAVIPYLSQPPSRPRTLQPWRLHSPGLQVVHATLDLQLPAANLPRGATSVLQEKHPARCVRVRCVILWLLPLYCCLCFAAGPPCMFVCAVACFVVPTCVRLYVFVCAESDLCRLSKAM